MIEVKYSIYFTNHLNEVKKINIDNIVDIESSILEIENKKLYASFSFITNGVYYHPSVVGDLQERIEFKYQINNNEIKSIKFVIDSIEYLPNNNIRIFCKTKGIKYSEKYSGLLNTTIRANSLKELINALLKDIEINTDNLSDFTFHFDYSIEDKSIEDVINDLSKITDFDFYFKGGIVYFEDKKRIKKDDEAVYRFSEYEDILNFSTSTNKDDKKVNKIVFNTDLEPIVATPSILLDIKDSPQCCSPDEVKIYTDDDGNTYKISPVNAFFIVYYSPLVKKPHINIPCKSGERIVVEKFELQNDEFVRLSGGIKELIAVEGVSNYVYKEGYNVLAFDFVEKGELKVTYKTDVLYGTIEHSKYPKIVNFKIKHFNQIIDYDHKIELNGYYPIPYKFILNLISDWGIDSSDAINRSVTISKKSGDVFVIIGEFTSNSFGELEFEINEYGTYKFETDNYEALYLDWYINKKNLFMDEVNNA